QAVIWIASSLQRKIALQFCRELLAMTPEGTAHALRRWLHRCCAEEETQRLCEAVEEGRQDLARIRRAGLPRVGRRRRQAGQVDLVSAKREAEIRRNRRVRLDHVQDAGPA